MIRDIRIKSMISGTLNATLKHALISIETFGNSVSNSLGFFFPSLFCFNTKEKAAVSNFQVFVMLENVLGCVLCTNQII